MSVTNRARVLSPAGRSTAASTLPLRLTVPLARSLPTHLSTGRLSPVMGFVDGGVPARYACVCRDAFTGSQDELGAIRRIAPSSSHCSAPLRRTVAPSDLSFISAHTASLVRPSAQACNVFERLKRKSKMAPSAN